MSGTESKVSQKYIPGDGLYDYSDSTFEGVSYDYSGVLSLSKSTGISFAGIPSLLGPTLVIRSQKHKFLQ